MREVRRLLEARSLWELHVYTAEMWNVKQVQAEVISI